MNVQQSTVLITSEALREYHFNALGIQISAWKDLGDFRAFDVLTAGRLRTLFSFKGATVTLTISDAVTLKRLLDE